MASKPIVVTVFGSSQIREGSSEYDEAMRLGRLLAENGFVLCNGGYDGTMEAAARGSKEAGGRTVGVPVEIYSPQKPNPWIDEYIHTPHLLVRLEKLTGLGEAYVVLKGGMGTLLEMALVWNLVHVGTLSNRPIILVGECWAKVMKVLRRELTVRPQDVVVLTHADSVEQAVRMLVEHFQGSDHKAAAGEYNVVTEPSQVEAGTS